jgi:hypothetical protein
MGQWDRATFRNVELPVLVNTIRDCPGVQDMAQDGALGTEVGSAWFIEGEVSADKVGRIKNWPWVASAITHTNV